MTNWRKALTCGICATFCILAWPFAALSVPEADSIDIQVVALKLAINDHTRRYQVKVMVTARASDEDNLSGLDLGLLNISRPDGEDVTMAAEKYEYFPLKFKSARAMLFFKAVGDDKVRTISNVPIGFFDAPGPFKLTLTLRGESYTGEFGFGEPVGMQVEQLGAPVANFCLAEEQPLAIYTDPPEFGPVYYREQDLTNFVFQLANIDQALAGGDFHIPQESPRYFFQVRTGDGSGGPMVLVDPLRYIKGYEEHMIRSERTGTPLDFAASEFNAGEVVVIDFSRQDYLDPTMSFSGPTDHLSGRTVVVNRVFYALHVELPPTPEELGLP